MPLLSRAVGPDVTPGLARIANDAMAGAAIQAMEDAGMTNIPPITGQDAELAAVQRIVSGEQYMSVYKPYPGEAEGDTQIANRLRQDAGGCKRGRKSYYYAFVNGLGTP